MRQDDIQYSLVWHSMEMRNLYDGFWNRLSWAREPERRILMFMWTLGPLVRWCLQGLDGLMEGSSVAPKDLDEGCGVDVVCCAARF